MLFISTHGWSKTDGREQEKEQNESDRKSKKSKKVKIIEQINESQARNKGKQKRSGNDSKMKEPNKEKTAELKSYRSGQQQLKY